MSDHEQLSRVRQQLDEVMPGAIVTADELDENPPVIVPDRFVIDDAQKASWVARKIIEAREYGQRVKAWSERELHRAEREETWLLRRFGAELEAWTQAELQRRGGRAKSVNLPGGRLGFRLQLARVEIIDEPGVLAWCRQQLPVALKITVEANDQPGLELLQWQEQHVKSCRLRQQVLREQLNVHCAETGEVPEGANLRAAADAFYVR